MSSLRSRGGLRGSLGRLAALPSLHPTRLGGLSLVGVRLWRCRRRPLSLWGVSLRRLPGLRWLSLWRLPGWLLWGLCLLCRRLLCRLSLWLSVLWLFALLSLVLVSILSHSCQRGQI